uniref:Uncharacterized protein n=1 Tax=Oryza barthii TaxID=65489 RepID=A0A0D3HV83_9ORYZ
MCSEVLGIKSSAGHVAMEILPHEILEPESKLPHICEKRRGATTASTDNDAMEREAHCVRLTRGATGNVTVSNGKNDVMDGEKGKHGEKTVEYIENVKSSK